jgi:hypothetical protein
VVERAAGDFLKKDAKHRFPKLVPLSSCDLKERFGLTAPFKDDAGSQEHRDAVLHALSRVPSYRLLYGGDPSVAAVFCRGVLNTHQLIEDGT